MSTDALFPTVPITFAKDSLQNGDYREKRTGEPDSFFEVCLLPSPSRRLHASNPSIFFPNQKNRTEIIPPVEIQERTETVLKEINPGSFQVLASWEGVVRDIDEDGFLATLTSIKGDRGDEEAGFSWDDVSEHDRDLVQKGAVFYWTIGHSVTKTGSRSRSSAIRFRRLPAWDSLDFEKAGLFKKKLQTLFGINNGGKAELTA